jgi:sugar O-acyltransferase (sialic acid O-acetyltransferase NeuD family)
MAAPKNISEERKSARKIVVFGAGGHGKVVMDIATQCGYEVMGFIDDDPEAACLRSSLFVLGDRTWIRAADPSEVCCALGIGQNNLRMEIAQFVTGCGMGLPTLVSPGATVSGSVDLGRGVVVMAGAVINAMSRIGEGAIVNSGAVVEHDSRIGRYAHISPNASLGGDVEVGDFAHIGIGATVLPSRRIGTGSILGAGSVATTDIPDHVVAFGVPAKVRRPLAVKL